MNLPTVAQAMQMAQEHLQSGRLTEAEVLYRQVLARVPEHGGALQMLGVLAAQSGDFARGASS